MATKYVSALDGGEMDSALMDMATHTSEAWAVGTRNGTPVSGGDVTYHNNAKYYSDKVSTDTQRAEDAAARAEAAVPAGTAGAVFFDRVQSLTTAQQEQAKANIMAGGTNPNLLDNPWFTAGNVVNQRGVATIPHTQYGIDRWKGEHGSATITVTDAGLAYQGVSADLYQPMESSLRTFLNGKTLTASVLKSDGTIESGSAVFTNGAKTQFISNIETGSDVFISAVGNFNLRYLNHTSSVTVVAVKLELGSVSTLANDVPPDYGTELLKCLRYQWVVTAENIYGVVGQATMTTQNTQGMMVVKLPVPMRAVPTLSYSGSFRSVGGNGTSIQVGVVTSFAISTNASNKNFVRVDVTGTNMGNTGTSVVIGADSDATAKLIFDANL